MLRTMMITGVLSTAMAAFADVPTYSTFELQCRANFTVNGGGFNLPGDSFFTNGTPDINDLRDVTVRLSIVARADGDGLWFGRDAVGQTEYIAPSDGLLSDPSVNNDGLTVFEQSFIPQDGLYFYASADDSSGLVTDQPIGATSWGSPTVNADGNIGYRAGFLGDNAYYIWNGVSATLVAAEVDLVSSSPYSFIFTPMFNNANQIAAKVRLGASGQFGDSRPDEIRLFNMGGSSTLIETDIDGDPTSPFDSFDNSVALTNDGRVAFISNLTNGERGVFLSDGEMLTEIATTANADISDIEFFSPAVNDNGLVAFRGVDGTGLQAIFVGDGETLRRVVGEHDVLRTDLGAGRIDQNDRSTVFGGSIRINVHGDIVFNAALTPANNDQIEWGSGIFVAQADPAAEPCPWDCTPDNGDGNFGNGIVNIDDVLAIINAFGDPGGPCDNAPDNGDGTFGNGVINIDDILGVINNIGDCP